MQHIAKLTVLGLSVSALALLSGCEGGSDVISSLFGGGGNTTAEVISALTPGSSDPGTPSAGPGSSGPGGPGGGGPSSTVATLHQPEPYSMALFWGGLAGLAYLRRRKTRKSSNTRKSSR
jgi:hypothetical protein